MRKPALALVIALTFFILSSASYALSAQEPDSADPEAAKDFEQVRKDFPLDETKEATPELMKALATLAEKHPKSIAAPQLYRDYIASLQKSEARGEIPKGEAVKLLEASVATVKAHPTLPQGAFFLRMNLMRLSQEDPGKVLKVFKEYLDLVAKHPERGEGVHLFIGYASLQDDQYADTEEALLALGKARKIYKDNPEALREIERVGAFLSIVGKEPEVKGPLIGGGEIDLKSRKGKVVLFDAWASWCGPCRDEMPFLKELYEKYHAKGLEIVGLNLDEEVEKAEAYIKQEKIDWPNIHRTEEDDDAKYGENPAKRYRITTIPFNFVVGRGGKIIARKVRDHKQLEKLIEDALK